MNRVLTNTLRKVNRLPRSKREIDSPALTMSKKNLSLVSCHYLRTVAGAVLLALGSLALPCLNDGNAQEVPSLVEVVDFSKLLPLFPNAPSDWTAEKAEGSTDDSSGFKITTAHRDYKKGEADNAPLTSISILDAAANPDYITSTTAAWTASSSTPEGYSKPVTIDGNPGFETFEKEGKHGTLWLMVAKRYFVQIETQGQDPKDLQEWMKRVDLKKLAEIK
jgi:hypothetical protein